MSRQHPYIPLGCDQQERVVPTMYSRRIDEPTQGASCCSELLADEDQSVSADAEVALILLKALAAIACFALLIWALKP